MQMRSLVKHGYTQTGGSCVVENQISTDNLKIYNAEFKIGDEILNFKKEDNLSIKIDVEGIEKQIIQSIDFKNYKNIYKLIIESLNCNEVLNCNFTLKIVNGYVEHITLKN